MLKNPHGNRVRFVPIAPNNANRVNSAPPPVSKPLIFKPFIPKHITICANKENINTTKFKNVKETTNNIPITRVETPQYSSKFNMENSQHVNLTFSQKQQELQNTNASTSFFETSNYNGNNLPTFPSATICRNDNNSTNVGYNLQSKNNAFIKPNSSDLNGSSQILQNTTNYGLQPKFQNNIQGPLNTANNSQFNPSFLVPKLPPIVENANNFGTSGRENAYLATNQNVNTTLEPNSFNCINQTFNMDEIWKDYQFQPKK